VYAEKIGSVRLRFNPRMITGHQRVVLPGKNLTRTELGQLKPFWFPIEELGHRGRFHDP
jgi:hypothetical protein